jgi:(S)-ureidoglycine aminohydrolase
MPIAGFPSSKLPAWPETDVHVLAAPALGTEFVEYYMNVPRGRGTRHTADGRIETFFYVLSGDFALALDGQPERRMTSGGFALVPPTADYRMIAAGDGVLLMLKKAYEPAEGIDPPEAVIGNQADVPGDVYMNDEGTRLQTLLPDDLAFDMAMNIFTFDPGRSLPVVETHVMEHGLYFLEGTGLYYLDDEWMEVEAGDFIWMGPYVPQSFYATGPTPAKYIYYKNVNREIAL